MSRTKAQLEREIEAQRDIIAALGEEIEALRDIFTAARESPRDANWVVGYIGGIGASGDLGRGNIGVLRAYAQAVRQPRDVAIVADAIADGAKVIVAEGGYPDVAEDDETEGLYETRMACGDSLADAAPYAEGAPMWCPRHGETTAITPEQWLGLTTVEHEAYPAGAPDEPQPHHSQATGYIALDRPTLAGTPQAGTP